MKINMHTSHPSAFISSTFVDLHEERTYVAEVLRNRGLNINALDVRPASTQSSKKEIISGIRESDFVILLIGDRYGSILQSMTESDTKSITWWEYQKAVMFGKPVIAYFKNVDATDPSSHDDPADHTYKIKRKLFTRFKKIVSTKHNPAYFTDAFELADKIDKSLISIYRSGVKTLSSKNSELSVRVSQLESEVQSLSVKTPSTNTSGLGNSNPLSGGLSGHLNPITDQPEIGLRTNALIDVAYKKK